MKSNSQTFIEGKKKSIAHVNPPLIEGLVIDTQKNLWEGEIESPLDEKKLYKNNNVDNTENSPSQLTDSASLRKPSQFNKFALSNNFIQTPDNLHSEDTGKKDLLKLRQIENSEKKISFDEDRDRLIFHKGSENERLEQMPPPQETQKPINNKASKSKQSKIIPGYTKNCIDENNPDYNSVQGLFTESEIKEAFDTLDMNKNQYITAEELAFFLDVLEEEVQEEEIEEMIRLCDIEGNGKVKYEEFQRMASGQSLAPIGQAYPPTFQMIERKKQLETAEFKPDNSLAKMRNLKNVENDHSVMSKKNEFESIETTFINKTKVQRDYESKIQSNTTKTQIKESSETKKNNLENFIKHHSLYGEKLMKSFDYLKQIDIGLISECDYGSFLKYFGPSEDNEINKNAFNSFVENEDKNINLKFSLFLFDSYFKKKFFHLFNLLATPGTKGKAELMFQFG